MVQKLFKRVMPFLYGSALLFSVTLEAQDFHLSQYDASPVFLNPSMTGMFDGKFRAHMHYRNQWSAISTHPFTTAGITLDAPIKKIGVGLQIMNFTAGAGDYTALNALLSFSYDLASKTNLHHLAVGIQGGILQKAITGDQLIFGNQYDAANGGGFNKDIASGETVKNLNFIVPVINAGALYYYGNSKALLNPFIGFSAFNLNQPEEKFFQTGIKLPLRYYIHGGIKIYATSKAQLLSKVSYMTQAKNKEITASLILHYFMKDANTFFIVGPTYRLKDAAVIELGIKKGAYTIIASYDVNTSALKNVTYYKGGFELSITYVLQKSKVNHIVNCPRL